MESDTYSPRSQLLSIFRAGVARVDPYEMIRSRVRVQNDVLTIGDGAKVGPGGDADTSNSVDPTGAGGRPRGSGVPAAEGGQLSLDLTRFRRIVVVGAGKATSQMAHAVEEVLGDRIADGVIAVKPGHSVPLTSIHQIEAGHPVPDRGSVEAGREIVRICSDADGDTLVIALVSGGGSALLEVPISYSSEGFADPADGAAQHITLEDLQETTRVLLACGAPIGEVNTLRKHLSRIKGGRFAELAAPATVVAIILSDVVGDRLDAIASGMTTWDATTYADAAAIIEKYGIRPQLPDRVVRALDLGRDGALPETPKSGAAVFDHVHNVLLGTNHDALDAAARFARSIGLSTVVLSSRITGESREVGAVFAGIARDLATGRGVAAPPACLIAGGETTVTIRGNGLGGRNQEMALSVLRDFAQDRRAIEKIWFLSAATDGNDGPTDAAGGFADAEAVAAAEALGGDGASASIARALERNDSYRYLDSVGALVRTGPTNTNVCDMQIILVR